MTPALAEQTSLEPPESTADGVSPARQRPNPSWLARVIWEIAGERHPNGDIHGRRGRTFREERSRVLLSSNRNQVTPYDVGHYIGRKKFVADLPGLMNLCLLGKKLAETAITMPRARRRRAARRAETARSMRRNVHLLIFRGLKIIHSFLGNEFGITTPSSCDALRHGDRRLVPTGRPPPYDAPWPTSPILLRRLGIERLLTAITT